MIHDDRLEGKTRFLTRDNDQNDPIDRRIDGYSFRDFEREHRCSRDEFFLIDRQNLSLITPWTLNRVLKRLEAIDSRMEGVDGSI